MSINGKTSFTLKVYVCGVYSGHILALSIKALTLFSIVGEPPTLSVTNIADTSATLTWMVSSLLIVIVMIHSYN